MKPFYFSLFLSFRSPQINMKIMAERRSRRKRVQKSIQTFIPLILLTCSTRSQEFDCDFSIFHYFSHDAYSTKNAQMASKAVGVFSSVDFVFVSPLMFSTQRVFFLYMCQHASTRKKDEKSLFMEIALQNLFECHRFSRAFRILI